ncbi:hypothetical protein AAVH_29357, partial [Aphelenchoides avenae]
LYKQLMDQHCKKTCNKCGQQNAQNGASGGSGGADAQAQTTNTNDGGRLQPNGEQQPQCRDAAP